MEVYKLGKRGTQITHLTSDPQVAQYWHEMVASASVYRVEISGSFKDLTIEDVNLILSVKPSYRRRRVLHF